MGLFGTGTASGDGLLGRASSAASSLFDSLRQEDGEFTYIEDEVGIPRGTLYALMMAESEITALHGLPTKESPAGALGPFQLLPKTAKQYNANPYNLHEAARAAAHEIKRGLDKTDSLDKALAVYNYGYGNAKRRGFNLKNIDKFQKDFGKLIDENGNPRSETTEHIKRFHKYFGKPEMNIDWMKSKSSKNAPQMYPQSKDGAVREGQQHKRLMYPPPKTLQEVTATSQVQPALRPPNSLSALEQLNEYEKMFSGKSLASQINSRSFNPNR